MTKMAKTRLILALAALIWCVLCLLMSRRDLLEWSQRMVYPEDGCRVETPEHWNVSICSYMVLKDASDVLVLPFTDFLTTPWMSECFQTGSTPEYALVVPDGMYRKFMDAVTVHTVHSMVQVLRRHPWLQVVSGAPVVLESDQRPICTLKRKKWTIELREEYSEFDDGSRSISIRHCDQEKSIRTVLDCYPCDLLPDVFLIRTNLMDEAGDPEVNLTSLAALNASARLPLFMALKGKAAYCPALKVLQGPYNEPLNLTCNDLRMVWDGNFVMIPPLTGVYRLILYPRGDRPLEHWLGCTWAQEAYETKLPVHCSNWVRQFVFDTVDILEKKMKLDYRIVYGLLLGAVRTGDVIPWSVDGDIAVEVSWPHNFRHKRWIRLGEYSQWRYSNKDRYETVPHKGRGLEAELAPPTHLVCVIGMARIDTRL